MQNTHKITLPTSKPRARAHENGRSRAKASSRFRLRRRSTLLGNGSSISSVEDDIIATLDEPSTSYTSTRKPRRAAILASEALNNLINESESPLVELEDGEEDTSEEEGRDWEEDDDYDAEGEIEEMEVEGAESKTAVEEDDEEIGDDEEAEGEEEILDSAPIPETASLFDNSYTPTAPSLLPTTISRNVPAALSISPLKSLPGLASPFDRSDAPSPPSARSTTFPPTIAEPQTSPSPPSTPSFSSASAIATPLAPTKITPDLPLYDGSISFEPRRRFSSLFVPTANTSFFQSLASSSSTSHGFMDASTSSLLASSSSSASSATIGTSTTSIFGSEIFSDEYSRLSFSLSDVRRPSYACDGFGALMDHTGSTGVGPGAGYFDFEAGRLSLSRRNSLGLALF